MRPRSTSAMLACLVAAFGGACTDAPDAPNFGGVYLYVTTPAAITIPQLGRTKIEAHVKGPNGERLADSLIHYEHSGSGIVRVSRVGEIESLGPPGDVVVSVLAGTARRDVAVSVRQDPTSIVVQPFSVFVDPADSVPVEGWVVDATGEAIGRYDVRFESRNERVAVVTGSGWVRGVIGGTTHLEVRVSPDGGIPVPTVPVHVSMDSRIAERRFLDGRPVVVAVTSDRNVLIGLDEAGSTSGLGRMMLDSPDAWLLRFVHHGAYDLGLTPDERYVLVAPGWSVLRTSVFELPGLAQTGVIPPAPLNLQVLRSVVSADGQRVFILTDDGPVYEGDGPVYPPNLFAVDVSGGFIGEAGVVVDSNAVRGVGYAWNQHHAGLAVAPSGDALYVGGADTIRVFDTNGLVKLTEYVVPGFLAEIALAPDGSVLYVANEPHGLSVIDLGTGAAETIDVGGGVWGLAMTPDGATLYLAMPAEGLVQIVDVRSRTVVGTIDVTHAPRDVAISPDGTVAVVANVSGWVDIVPIP